MSVLAFVVVVILVSCCSMTVNARKCYEWEFTANINEQKTEIDCPANDQYCFTGSQGQYNGGSCNSYYLLKPFFSCTGNNCTRVTVPTISPNPINVCCCDSDLCNQPSSPISANPRKCYNYMSTANANIPQTQIDCPANDQYCFTGSQGKYNGGSCSSNPLLQPFYSCTGNNCKMLIVPDIDSEPINVCCCDSDFCNPQNSANSPISKLTATTTLMMLIVIVSATFINAR